MQQMTNANTLTYACTRCAGVGRLACFSNVLGGVCFKCGGSGKQATKPAAPSVRFTVYGVSRLTGQPAHTYNERARTAAEAVRKARKCFARASEAFRAEFDMTNAYAVAQ